MIRKESALAAIIILGVAALAYLPLVARFGYAYDDWYLMYAAKAYGPGSFHAIYSIDRPLRAYVMAPAYTLFGEDPLWYNLSAWGFRVIAGLAFLWIQYRLWKSNKWTMFLMAVLFVLYPGFLSLVNGIDYQSQMLSLAAGWLSIAFSLEAVLSPAAARKWLWAGISILLGWLYLGLVEYHIGIEAIRAAVIFIAVSRQASGWAERFRRAVIAWLPYLLIPGWFAIWRIYFFETERKATDLGLQFSGLLAAPFETLVRWTGQLTQDLVDVLFAAWIVPLRQLTAYIDAWGILSAVAVLFIVFFIAPRWIGNGDQQEKQWIGEALGLGLFALVFGLLPIILVNREVVFPHFSRYALVASTGVAMLLVALIHLVPARRLRDGLAAVLISLAVLTHAANSRLAAAETASMNRFWWQVAWRIPSLERGTTILAHYPLVSIVEDYIAWGPANLIYYPNKLVEDGIRPAIFAAVPNDDALEKVLARDGQVYFNRRTIATFANYRNILILTQPSTDSCVQVINGTRPELSPFETSRFVEMAPFSEPEHILLDESFHAPPEAVFGSEPTHDWCYFYQKATLARQWGEWQQVVELGGQAASGGFAPGDPIEWIPFLQAYAVLGDVDRLTAISAQVQDPNVRGQACQILADMGGLSPEVRVQARELFCSGG